MTMATKARTTPRPEAETRQAPTMSSSLISTPSSSLPSTSSDALHNSSSNSSCNTSLSDSDIKSTYYSPTESESPSYSFSSSSTVQVPAVATSVSPTNPNQLLTTEGTATSTPRPIPSFTSKPTRSGISDLNRSIFGLTIGTIGLIIPPTELSTTSPSYSGSLQTLPTPIESLRRHPTDLTSPIPEECDEETCSESLPNDPVTPISGRQSRDLSRDLRFRDSNEFYHRDLVSDHSEESVTPSQNHKDRLNVPFVQPYQQQQQQQSIPTVAQSPRTVSTVEDRYRNQTTPIKKVVTNKSDRAPPTQIRPRPTPLRSSSSWSRAMSSIFKRSNAQSEENIAGGANSNGSTTPAFKVPSYSAGTSVVNIPAANGNGLPVNSGRRRFSYHRSVATTRSNTPPSPGSPLEMPLVSRDEANGTSMPTSNDFLENNAKKSRAHTGLSLRQRVNFVSNAKSHPPRRARSLERKKQSEEEQLTRQPWAIPPESGVGMKARRLSLSLPDDFTVDIAELLKEYEYQHKFFGRHGKHLGKGATSKVTLMARKGCPGELYAVKEFRSKSNAETLEEYEKKIKSEYSIAKSLHHPNVVETIRLCTDHGRWNHVMEYCSEGDLFSLVQKKYLREEGRDIDRLCIFKQLCQGINYLHKNGIAHRDIKLENLLMTKDSKLKITDFGVSEVFSGIHPGLREAGGQCGVAMGEVRYCKPGICGSLPYIAPEVLSKREEYDPRPLDVWSSAIVMINLVFSSTLWDKAEDGLSTPHQKTYNDLVAGWKRMDAKKETKPETSATAYPKLEAFELFIKPIGLRRLLLHMLHPDPKKRITMNDVITDRWMKNVECCQLESYDDQTKFIDVSKKDCMKSGTGKIFCHNHLPPLASGHSLPPMPGKPGY